MENEQALAHCEKVSAIDVFFLSPEQTSTRRSHICLMYDYKDFPCNRGSARVTWPHGNCNYATILHARWSWVETQLLGTNGFYVKAQNERFTAMTSRCRQNLKYENFTSSFGRLLQNFALKSVPHVQHDYFSSFIQSIKSLICGVVVDVAVVKS